MVGRAGDRVSVISGESKEVGVRGFRLLDFVVALGPFHEDHTAPRGQPRSHAIECRRDGAHGPADHSGGLARVIRSQLVGVDFDPLQAEAGADPAEKLGAGAARLGQDHLDVGPGDFQRNARQSGAGTHIDER